MKRIFSILLVGGVGVALLGGCPIYSDGGHSNGGCVTSNDCPGGTSCDTVSGSCVAPQGGTCTTPTDCASGQTCAANGLCQPGDCSTNGCVSGYLCKVANGSASCVKDTKPKDDSGFNGCANDAACSTLGAGAKCLNGTCVAPADECSDTTQCNNGYQCVQGACTPGCSGAKPCPTGYSCDLNKGVCTGNPNVCINDGQCLGGNVCIQQHCVAPCGANNTCAGGLICVGGGCIPDQKPQFVCSVEGKQDACATGSLCLHHNCYIACDSMADAGTQCKNADKFNICKSVVTKSGSYSVCGSASNLGNDCDPTIAKNCAGGLICIDGFCR